MKKFLIGIALLAPVLTGYITSKEAQLKPQAGSRPQNNATVGETGDQSPSALSELIGAARSVDAPVVSGRSSNDAPRSCHLVCVERNELGYCLNYTPVCP